MSFLLGENSHQGFEAAKRMLCLAQLEAKPKAALGMPACLRQNRVEPRCSGKERDAESGLDYFGARYFSGPQGRFTSADAPFADQYEGDPQSWNLYSYARNNPLRFVDFNGRACRVNSQGGEYDDKNPGQSCAEVLQADKKIKPSTVVEAYTPGGLSPRASTILVRSEELAGPTVKALAAATLTFIAGAGTMAAVASSGVAAVTLQGAAEAATLSLPLGAKISQMMNRAGPEFVGSPAAFLSYARDLVVTAVRQGTYVAGDYISRAGSTTYRVGNDYLTVGRDGKLLSYVKNATPGQGVAAKYAELGGR